MVRILKTIDVVWFLVSLVDHYHFLSNGIWRRVAPVKSSPIGRTKCFIMFFDGVENQVREESNWIRVKPLCNRNQNIHSETVRIWGR